MLSGKEKRFLRGLANQLEPMVQVGKNGVCENVRASLEQALTARELVKVRVLKNCPQAVPEVAELLAGQSASELVQILGRSVLLYRRNAEKPVIRLPGRQA